MWISLSWLSCTHGVEDPVDALERPLVLDVDAVVDLVVELHGARLKQVRGLGHVGQRQLGQLRLLHLLDDRPVGADGDGRLALLQLDLAVVVLAAALLLLPFAYLALALPLKIIYESLLLADY